MLPLCFCSRPVRRHYGMSHLKPFERISLGQDLAALPSPKTGTPQLLLTSGPESDKTNQGTSSSQQATGRVSSSSLATSAPAATGGAERDSPIRPKAKVTAGVMHLCEMDGCQLPPPFGGGGNHRSSGGKRNGGSKGSDGGSGRSGKSASRGDSLRHR